MLRHQGTDDTGDKDHDHHTVKHVIVHQILSGGHFQSHAHHNHRDGTCSMSRRQTEHHISISLRQTEKKTGDIGCYCLSECTEEGYQKHNPQHVDASEQRAHIDKHANTD